MRVLRVADYDGIERKVRERVKNQLLPEAKVELIFERRRPPLEATDASRALAKHAQTDLQRAAARLWWSTRSRKAAAPMPRSRR